MNPKPILAINTLAYHGYDLPTAVREVAKLGVEYIEPALISSYYPEFTEEYFTSANAQELLQLMNENNLKIVALAAHMDLGQVDAITGFKKRMEFAKELDARIIHTNTTQQARKSTFLKNIGELLPLAESLNLIVALENPGDGEDNIVSSGKAGASLIEQIGSKHVRLNYDFSNVFSYSQGKLKPEDDFKYALSYAAHFHLKEIAPKGSSGWAFVEIGKGVTDYKTILHDLAQEPNLPPMSIELPLRFERGADFVIFRNPASRAPELSEIRKVLKDSLDFIRGELTKAAEGYTFS